MSDVKRKMSMPVDHYSKMPNALADDWLRDLGLAETKVLIVVMRKTWGWHKSRDHISLSQLEELTGLERRHIINGAKSLCERGLLRRITTGPKGRQTTEYELLMPGDSNSFDQCPKDTGGGVPATPGGGVFTTPTKETHTKETKKEKPVLFFRDSKDYEKKKLSMGSHVKLTSMEYTKLIETHGEDLISSTIEDVNNYCEASKPKGYANYRAAIEQFIKKNKARQYLTPSKISSSPLFKIIKKYDMRKTGYVIQLDAFGSLTITSQTGYSSKFSSHEEERLLDWLYERRQLIKKKPDTNETQTEPQDG